MTIETVVPLPERRRWTALAVIALIQFILVLDITVVNNALPHIQSSLHFSRAGLAWVVDGYVLTAGGLLLLGGRLADLLGRKRMFMIGVTLFAAASVMSGAAVDSGMLVASRLLQGAGEALAAPAAFGLVALLFTEPKERAKAIGIMGGVAGLGGTLGPVLSGMFISIASWRWIFYVNVPVAIVSVLAVSRLVAESRARRPDGGRQSDATGAVLGTAGLSGIVYGFIAAGNHAWGSSQVWVPLLAGGLAGAASPRGRSALERRTRATGRGGPGRSGGGGLPAAVAARRDCHARLRGPAAGDHVRVFPGGVRRRGRAVPAVVVAADHRGGPGADRRGDRPPLR